MLPQRGVSLGKYDLLRLGSEEFEHVVQALLNSLFGVETIIFGKGRDGAREATFKGTARLYASSPKLRTGSWIVQAKFHDYERAGAPKARSAVLAELDDELNKIVHVYKHACDYYILATNVPLSGTATKGSLDVIDQSIRSKYPSIKEILVLAYDNICRMLDAHADVRKAYLHLITPGDLLAEIYQSVRGTSDIGREANAIKVYLSKRFSRDKIVDFGQIGRKEQGGVTLASVFTDLAVSCSQMRVADENSGADADPEEQEHEEIVSGLSLLLEKRRNRSILIGGPGQGKSTLSQFVCQVHRSLLLNAEDDYRIILNSITPLVMRIPFRVLLREYAQWIYDRNKQSLSIGLDAYIASLISAEASVPFGAENLHKVMSQNPCLLVLDGLDEVTDRALRGVVLAESTAFVEAVETGLLGDIQVLGSSRPGGHRDLAVSDDYALLTVQPLDNKKVIEYASKWTLARGVEEYRRQTVLAELESKYQGTEPFSSLLTTPLQVAIFMTIISAGADAPRQREALFAEYVEAIYVRESGKRSPANSILHTEKDVLFALHDYIGYLLHRDSQIGSDATALMDRATLKRHIVAFLKQIRGGWSTTAEVSRWADEFIADARDRLVMLVEPRDDYFGFEVRSFQEFFAGAHLADAENTDQLRDRFKAIAPDEHWRQAALFMAGRVARTRRAELRNLLDVLSELNYDDATGTNQAGTSLGVQFARERVCAVDYRHEKALYGILYSSLEKFPDLDAARLLPADGASIHMLSRLQSDVDRTSIGTVFNLLDQLISAGVDVSTVAERMISDTLATQDFSRSLFARLAVRWRCDPAFIKTTFVDAGSSERMSVYWTLRAAMRTNLPYACNVLRKGGFGRQEVVSLYLEANSALGVRVGRDDEDLARGLADVLTLVTGEKVEASELITQHPEWISCLRFEVKDRSVPFAPGNIARRLEELDISDVEAEHALERFIFAPLQPHLPDTISRQRGATRENLVYRYLELSVSSRRAGTPIGIQFWNKPLPASVVDKALLSVDEMLTLKDGSEWRLFRIFDRLSMLPIDPGPEGEILWKVARRLTDLGRSFAVPSYAIATVGRVLANLYNFPELGAIRDALYAIVPPFNALGMFQLGRRGLIRCEPSKILSGIFRDIEDKSLSASREKILETAILSIQSRAWTWPPIVNTSNIPLDRLAEFAVRGTDIERYFAVVVVNTVAEPGLDLLSQALNFSDANDFSFEAPWFALGKKYAKAKAIPSLP